MEVLPGSTACIVLQFARSKSLVHSASQSVVVVRRGLYSDLFLEVLLL